MICHSVMYMQCRPLVVRPENSLPMLTRESPSPLMDVRSHTNTGFRPATRRNLESPTAMAQANVCLLSFTIPVLPLLVGLVLVGHRTGRQLFFPNSWSESHGAG